MLGNLDVAENLARKALETAPENAYVLDILIGVLISGRKGAPRGGITDIEQLFERLNSATQADDRSFYAARRAEYEWRHNSLVEACRLIDDARQRTPGIFHVHALRARIYNERGNKTIVMGEINKMRNIVYRTSGGERRSNLRPLLEIEAEYAISNGDYENAKKIYATRGVFTDKEALEQIRSIEYQQAMLKSQL